MLCKVSKNTDASINRHLTKVQVDKICFFKKTIETSISNKNHKVGFLKNMYVSTQQQKFVHSNIKTRWILINKSLNHICKHIHMHLSSKKNHHLAFNTFSSEYHSFQSILLSHMYCSVFLCKLSCSSSISIVLVVHWGLIYKTS